MEKKTSRREKLMKMGTYTSDDIQTEVAKEQWRAAHTMNYYLDGFIKCYIDELKEEGKTKNLDIIEDTLHKAQGYLKCKENELIQAMVVWEDATEEAIKQDGWVKPA